MTSWLKHKAVFIDDWLTVWLCGTVTDCKSDWWTCTDTFFWFPYPYPYIRIQNVDKTQRNNMEKQKLRLRNMNAIINRQYASLYNILMKNSESLIWVDFLITCNCLLHFVECHFRLSFSSFFCFRFLVVQIVMCKYEILKVKNYVLSVILLNIWYFRRNSKIKKYT